MIDRVDDPTGGTANFESSKGAARDRIMLEKIAELQGRLSALESELADVRRQRVTEARALKSLSDRVDRMRLDRQLKALPSWLAGRLKGRGPSQPAGDSTKQADRLLVIVPTYPSPQRPYGGQPIERRLRFYIEAGYTMTVMVPSGDETTYERKGVEVRRARLEAFDEVFQKGGYSQILVHHPTPEVWDSIKPFVGAVPVHVWIHGFEARDWRDSAFGLSEEELVERAQALDPINAERRRALGEIFGDERVTKIFVSEFMRNIAVDFVGVQPRKDEVIHNVIDPTLFPFRQRTEPDRLRVLAVRSFATRTYATDMMAAAIRDLSGRGVFEDLTFEIYGDGQHFETDTDSLLGFPNVSVTRGIVGAERMSSLMAEHGVMLIPTRLDSQGITIGEAMSTGMVVITNGVAAIPEFVDQESGMLCDAEDVKGLADAVERLYEEPARYLELSVRAAERVRSQCGPEQTVARELALIGSVVT